MEEWQFALEKEVAYKDVKNHHAVAFEASQKMEALEWMKARPAWLHEYWRWVPR